MDLPIPEYGANDRETIQNLMDTVTKLRKELEYLMYHLGDANIPDLAGMKGDIDGNHSLILQAEDNIALLVTDVAGNTSTINLHSGQIALLVTDVEDNTSSIIQQAGQIALLVTDVAGHTSTLTVQAGQIQSLVTTTNGHTSSITQQAGQIQSLVSTTNGLASSITQQAGEIALKVSKDGVISAINLTPEVIKLEANKIDLNGITNVASTLILGSLSNEGTLRFASGTTIYSVNAIDMAISCSALSMEVSQLYLPTYCTLFLADPTKHNIVAKFG